MLQTVYNSEFSRTMDLFKEIDDLSDLFLLEKNTKLDCLDEGYEDLQSKYSSLHENYAKEIENSKKVEKCLIKCLKFYSKLSKKYEVQQQIIRNLEENIKEKVNSLEEAQKNEEKMKGLIEVYRTERTLYAGQTNAQLRKEKEVLLDICCKLIGESVRSHSTSSLSNLLLRKFKKDLDDKNINLLKGKSIKLKDELDCDTFRELNPEFVKDEFKTEEKYSSDMNKLEIKQPDDDSNLLGLSQCQMETEGNSFLENENSQNDCDKLPFTETEQKDAGDVSSLPSLEELPLFDPRDNEQKIECDEHQSKPPALTSHIEREFCTENITELQFSEKLGAPTLIVTDGSQIKPEETPLRQVKGSNSIFDIGDPCMNIRDSGEQGTFVSEISFPINDEKLSFENRTSRVNLDLRDNDDDTFSYENEVFKIFKEMSSVRLLSPIRQINNCSVEVRTYADGQKENKKLDNASSSVKRNSEMEEGCCKNKKLKSVEEKAKCCLLDSIMSAMSIQNEEFKSQSFARKESGESGEVSERSSCEFSSPHTRTYNRTRKKENGKNAEKSGVGCRNSGRNRNGEQGIEKIVTEELKNFISSTMSSKEDADKSVKQCISVLSKKSEDVIAKCIVATVLEDIDEAVEVFERPAPPLTKTQHRLIVLLSVFRMLNWDSDKISTKILLIISEKLFPDNFFWPDDCVEAASRFYAALCRARNDPKTLWKFCLNAMTDMRQRCPLLMFTVLKTWPDALHDASTLKNNMLAVTIVNIFLHMPETEGLRNWNQKRKLAALKHLLINFYQFKVEDTIENYAQKVLEAIRREELGSEKSLVLLSKCRDINWTSNNVLPGLKSNLSDWFEGRVSDSVASAILSVIKQICPMLTQENNTKVKELALCLSEMLTSGKKNHEAEVNLVEVLLLLKQYPEVRKTICEWIPKNTIKENLRNEIINASAENILRELKLNRKKETKLCRRRKNSGKNQKGRRKGRKVNRK